jgi:hypothetical protein
MKIKFHSNENIEWYYMQLALNLDSNLIQFNSNTLNGILKLN